MVANIKLLDIATTLLEKETFRKQLALHIMKTIWRDCSFTRKRLKEIISIFI